MTFRKSAKKHVYDLQKTQENYFESGINNIRLTNEQVGKMQTSAMTLVLAEMAFLGALGLEHPASKMSATSLTVLVISIVLFFTGSHLQRIRILSAGRDFIQKSRNIQNYIKEQKVAHVEELQEEFKPKFNNVNSSKLVNWLFISSYLLIVLASFIILLLVWRLAL